MTRIVVQCAQFVMVVERVIELMRDGHDPNQQ